MTKKKLTDQDYRSLVELYQKQGDKLALESITKTSDWIVKSVVSKYNSDLPEELLEAGKSGLEKAVQKFDLSKRFKFLAYATWWIRHYVHKELGLPD